MEPAPAAAAAAEEPTEPAPAAAAAAEEPMGPAPAAAAAAEEPMGPAPAAAAANVPPKPNARGAPRAMVPCDAGAAGFAAQAPIVTAAVIRAGPGFLECPFFATAPSWRGCGQARHLIEAVECIGRRLRCHTITLCAAEHPAVRRVWRRLGFRAAPTTALTTLGAWPMDVVHMRNSVLLWKLVPEPPEWRTLVLRWNGAVWLRQDVDTRV